MNISLTIFDITAVTVKPAARLAGSAQHPKSNPASGP